MTPIVVILVLMVLAVGALLAATPYLMPPTECFAVTVPPSAQHDPRIRALKRSYARRVIAVALVSACALSITLVTTDLSGKGGELLSSTAVLVAALAPLAIGLALMLRSRAQVIAIKREQGWVATGNHAAAVIGSEEVAGPISLWWELLYLPVIVGIVVAGMLLYDRFPAQVPMQAGFDGSVTRYVPKSPAVALFPAAVSAFLALMMALAHWSILRSKRPVDPASPATSALAYGVFARVQSIVLLVGGLAICTVTGITFFLSSLGIISLGTAGVLVSVAAMGFVGAEMWAAIALGQSGSRLAAQLRTSDELARDDDAHWPLGMFYCNADDPSIMVPKRFGVGWTINVGRPASWALMGLIIAVSIAFVLATNAMVG